MVACLNRENDVYRAVEWGDLTIDMQGRIWRIAIRRRDGWTGKVHQDNRPMNLELATPAEQTKHTRQVLRRGRLDQYGQLNAMAKLTTEQVREICQRRADGELLRVLAADYGVREQAISRIARGDRRSRG